MMARDSEPRAKTPAEVLAVLPPNIHRLTREHFWVVAMRPNNAVIGVRCVAKGGVDHCAVDPREVFGFAIRKRATAIVLAHNHPSGQREPSSMDIHLTRQLVDGGKLLTIRVLDHLVVAYDGGFTSMLDTHRSLFSVLP